ncbi:unnamed protein product [Cylindrotheca closterium]|uniref:DUF6824 domain-containing protein n=1 Tax=Cylindrotheca closterium TaxID=2856 RepID=A0AAD2G0G6_9STRA|nr:unnamed protein product [Cylindrotheca closterium]
MSLSKKIQGHPKPSREARSNKSSNMPVIIPDDEDCCKLFAADVLCGRDRAPMTHPGNKRFRQMIMQKREAYQKATSHEARLSVTDEIMTTVGEYGGRFLRRNGKSGKLEQMEDGLARELIQKAIQCVPKILPKIPKRTPPTMLVRMVSEENTSSDVDDESRFQNILSDQRKIFEALMRQRGMNLP